jgi:mycofactocin precursor
MPTSEPFDSAPEAPSRPGPDPRPELVADTLIEDVSIDGMCGVY